MLRSPTTLRLHFIFTVSLLALTLAGGCRQEPRSRQRTDGSMLSPNTFKATWASRIDVGAFGRVSALYLRDDVLVAYTNRNVVYTLSAGGGQTQWIASDVVGRRDQLWPPLLLPALNRYGAGINRIFAFPSNTTYVIYTDEGRRMDPPTLIDEGRRAMTSPSFGDAGLAFVGLADGRAGRAARLDPTKLVNPVLVPILVDGVIIARPVVFAGIFFVATETGRVYAISPDGFQAWGEPYFATGGSVNANLTADEYGLYVPSTDSILYVLDRATGRQKWRYFAGNALYQPAFPTAEHIFLPVAGRVVCLSKTEGDTVGREPIWSARGARDVLSHDQQNVYLLHSDGSIVAHSKATGEELFRAKRSDFTRFARNRNGPTIYAATPGGEVVAIDPVLTRGQVGQMVERPVAPRDRTPLATAE